MRHVHRETCLADPGHSVNRADADRAPGLPIFEPVYQAANLGCTARKISGVTRQPMDRRTRRRRRGARSADSRWAEFCDVRRPGFPQGCLPACHGFEHRAGRTCQIQRVCQQANRVPACGQVNAALKVTDRPWAQRRYFGELLLRQPRVDAQLTQQTCK